MYSWELSEISIIYLRMSSIVSYQHCHNAYHLPTALYQEVWGKAMKKVVPCPSLDSNQMRPLCRKKHGIRYRLDDHLQLFRVISCLAFGFAYAPFGHIVPDQQYAHSAVG